MKNIALTSKQLTRLWRIITGLLLVVALFRIFALDIIPNAPNDTVHYLQLATDDTYIKDPALIFQPRGTKTSGYAIYLGVIHDVAPIFPVDSLTLMALSQRLLLAGGVSVLILQLGLFSAPIVFFLTSGHILATTNILYTEGLTTPLSILYAASLVTLYRHRWHETAHKKLWFRANFVLMSASVLLLILTRIAFVPLTLPIVSLIASPQLRRPHIRWTKLAIPAAIPLVFTVIYLLFISIDNYQTYAQFSPTTGSVRNFYWGVYQHTFVVNPENRTNPELEPYYDGGSPYPFIHGTESNCEGLTDYLCTEPILSARADVLIEAAGLDQLPVLFHIFLSAFVGGELEELQYRRTMNLRLNGHEYETDFLIGNWYSRNNGYDAFLDDFNYGKPVAGIDGLSSNRIADEDYRGVQRALTLIIVALFLLLLVTASFSWDHPAVYGLAAYCAVTAVTALNYVDLWRYILPAWITLLVLLTYAVEEGIKTRISGILLRRTSDNTSVLTTDHQAES